MEKNDVHIAAIQETKLLPTTKMKPTPNYTPVRKDRGRNKGGGLLFLIHHTIPFKQLQTPASLANDPYLEELSIEISSSNKDPLTIRNLYIPPASSCTQQDYLAPIQHLKDGLNGSHLILGDVNAHHSLWYTEDTEDIRGQHIADWLGDTDLGVLNENQPTRITSNSCTAPDLSLASSTILASCTWNTATSLSSDHLPLHIQISSEITKIPSENKTYINFNKADWTGFYNFTEDFFSKATLNNNVHVSEKLFRNTLNKAAKKFIPAGRIPKVLNAMPTETVRLLEERDELRKTNPADPRLAEMNKDINITIRDHRKKKWLEHLSNCAPNSKKLWTTVKSLTNPPKTCTNQSISFGDKHYLDPKKIANNLNRQYTPAATTKPTKAFRALLRRVRNQTDDSFNISNQQIIAALKKTKNSKALGPDNLSPLMLKKIGPNAINYLANLFNNVVAQAIIPPKWKVGRIIPILKPNKPADQGASYRPISLLSPLAKLLESVILTPLNAAIPLADHQHGFRKGRSTQTALRTITDHITTGLNKPKPVDRTVLVAVDLSKAFDTVNLELLLKDISELPLNKNIIKFLFSYLRGRQTYVEFRGCKSKHRKMRQGVPQGGVLSPVLFNLYMAKLPLPPRGIKLVTYADDSTVLGSGRHTDPVCTEINNYLDVINNWFKSRNLFISPSKSSATIFTTWSNEVNKELPIQIDGTKVPTVQNPKILGVTLDPMLSFKAHAKQIKEKVMGRNNILKALSGSSWGMDKEVLLTTYSAINKSVLSYCAPVWTPSLSQTNWNELQSAQNAGLRIATGCTKMTNVDHLHAETLTMPVKDHCSMLAKQALLSSARTNHPNHKDITAMPSRIMKPTLTTAFAEAVLPLTLDGIVVDDTNYKEGLKSIHTSCVQDTIAKQVNKILNAPPPKIDDSEKDLPRRTRTTLSQLRSGYSPFLQSYLARIMPNEHQNLCPKCQTSPHTKTHQLTRRT